jgi:hypothetical protein
VKLRFKAPMPTQLGPVNIDGKKIDQIRASDLLYEWDYSRAVTARRRCYQG